MIQESVAKLVQYGLTTGLIEKEDAIYTANRLLDLLNMDTLQGRDRGSHHGYRGR